MQPNILILAAGASSRMGGPDKLLLPVGGTPLLAHVARVALATGFPVTVAQPPDRPDRQAAIAGLPLQCLIVPGADTGIGASLAAGIAALPATEPALVLLADMPDIATGDLVGFIADWARSPEMILRATDAEGTPGHPVGFPAWLRPDLLRLTGDIGAREVLSRHKDRIRYYALPGDHATTDLDTKADWQKWQGRTP
ncbi:MAG: nucleotidyltransferase family protein [Tabrizicola sp.]|nr:nucleotidyltransferase family protein [Tabrizicola sp.]